MPWPARPAGPRRSARPRWPRWPRSVLAAAVGEPCLLGELKAAVEAVAGIGAPVPAGLTGRDGRPVHPARGAGTAVETGAVTGAIRLRLPTAAAGPEPGTRPGSGQRGAGHPRRHLAAGRQLQLLARGDHVRVGHLAAVGPPHGRPVGRSRRRGSRSRTSCRPTGRCSWPGLVRCRVQQNRDRHQGLRRPTTGIMDMSGFLLRLVRQKVPAACCNTWPGPLG